MQTRFGAGHIEEIANLTYDFSYLRRDSISPGRNQPLDDLAGEPLQPAAKTIPMITRQYFRQHWSEHFVNDGVTYEQCEAAYAFGFMASRHAFYFGHSWTDAEPSLKLDWADQHAGSNWERYMPAIRAGWDAGVL